MNAQQYDYIFFGSGCASLSTVMRMIASNQFNHKKILLIDKEPKINNDRTWCFWEKNTGFFEDIVYKKWEHLFFKTEAIAIPLQIGNYQYKMIRAIDFYTHCFSIIKLQENIDFVYGNISFENEGSSFKIKINEEMLQYKKGAILFNSLYQSGEKEGNKFYLLQHFKGRIVETEKDFFDAGKATIMDFSVSQKHGTTFMYVLPFSTKKALIEYTLFTADTLTESEYETALDNYLENNLHLKDYKIIEKEFGIIPMTNAHFPAYRNGMYFIGTAGGQTKASTGYTFQFIQKQAGEIVDKIIKNELLPISTPKNRFYFYDSTLLHILSKKLEEGKTIFSILFQKNRAEMIFKFLDNETSVTEEIKLLNTLPKKVFIKAGFIELIRMI